MDNGTRMKSLLFGLTLLIISLLSAAAEEPRGQTVLDEIVVTGTRIQQRPIDVPMPTDVITREKIEMSGALDVGDLIGKYVTGHFHKYNDLLSPVGLRGFRTESHGDDVKGHILLLIDGHRVGTGNAAKINLDRIERIEVIKGPVSALYGSAALGGVVNLITKKGDGELSATLSGDHGSFDYYKGQIAGGGEVNERFRFHATASYEEIGDYDDPKFGTVYNSGVTKKNIGGNLVFTIHEDHELRLGGNFADLSSESSDWTDGAYSTYVADSDKDSDKSHGYADLEYNGDFFDCAFHWRGLAYYLWDRNHWNWGYPDAESRQSKYTDTTLGTDHQFAWKMTGWNTLLLGFNLEQLEKESSAVADKQPSTPYIPSMDYDSRALFIQDSLDLWNNRVNLITAARYDRFDVKTKRPETGDLPDFNEKSECYDHLSPKVGIGAKFLDELLRVRANLGQGFRSPSADQLSADYVHGNGTHYRGNPDLEPETSLTYDAGFDVFHHVFTLQVGYFHSDYEDKIVQVRSEVDGVNTTTYENHGKAEIAGFDVGLLWWIGRTFDWPVDLSLWSNATFNTTQKDKETEEDLLYISDYEVKSGLDLSYGGFSTQLSHVLVGPQMITNNDTFEDEEKDSFEFWDLTLRYRFSKHWQVRASILNLFDDRVEWVRGYLMPERNYRAGVSYTY
jgi:vitamin B12 transporter